MTRTPGTSVRLRLTLSYAGFLMLAGVLLLTAVWAFLLRDVRLRNLVPDLTDLPRVFQPGNFGPKIFGVAAFAVLAFLLVFGLVGGWLLAGHMLAPLTRITDATRSVAAGSLSHRIRLPGRNDEFRELADAFDAMVAQLEAHVAEQRRFAANASHELRTPLATTQALLDVARADPGHDSGELIDRLHTVNARAIALTEALLLLGRADRRTFARERVDLSLLVEEATESLLPLAEGRGATITTACGPAPVTGSQALLLQLTTNLVHNAIVHNLAGDAVPRNGPGTVRVGTEVRSGTVLLTVENSGERLAPELVPTLVEPFRRGTDRVRGHDAGVGLGLAIVRSITHAHDGVLTLAPRTGGGLRVTVELPADRAAPATPEGR
ncbi:HAMP domain-containing sensor histidine kinase [Pseudonocardia sp. N23]|uniref:sensor histidine kinase n=1 Tax=Pseudonocardia sp. N23 TaxID=1987376 RepID=UPI000BFBE8EA|nr:HAMP domain-containing sensor histidine kinase [Pseudonocardia sp. N23]GAY08449.1 putative two-component system sensor kinase [Pseudonocardia sp. N23]